MVSVLITCVLIKEWTDAANDDFEKAVIKATAKEVTKWYMWPSIRSVCRQWAQVCIECQHWKIKRHVNSPVGNFVPPSTRFEHLHIDFIVMLYSENNRYYLTCVDWFLRWPEVSSFGIKKLKLSPDFFTNYKWLVKVGNSIRICSRLGAVQ